VPRIEVEPGQLQGAAAQQATVAASLTELVGRIAAVGASASAAGAPEAQDALMSWCANWQGSLGATASSVSALGTNTQAAASAYLQTDATAMPGMPR
jgi:uncharacterized protein YukE